MMLSQAIDLSDELMKNISIFLKEIEGYL